MFVSGGCLIDACWPDPGPAGSSLPPPASWTVWNGRQVLVFLVFQPEIYLFFHYFFFIKRTIVVAFADWCCFDCWGWFY